MSNSDQNMELAEKRVQSAIRMRRLVAASLVKNLCLSPADKPLPTQHYRDLLELGEQFANALVTEQEAVARKKALEAGFDVGACF
ncbi:hypothetical protein [Komagataeibacter medellinensis]|uniref:hypothetical protein n=1 Tax=Komagataeibacter medellinensis TaxID=1177712 RepID=UPI0011D1BB6D|nr:hypothetical protein [Komagataeibacter medellinensis]